MGTRNPPPRIRAALFDMDGLLIDSEDLYTICTNTLLERYNRSPLPWSIKAQMQGRPGPQAGAIFHTWAQLPITHEQFLKEQSELQREHFPKTKPLPGVLALLEEMRKRGVHMALATSSHRGNYELKSKHLPEIFETFFEPEHRVLGDDPRIPPGRGKPAPDIYLLALSTLNQTLEAKGETPIKPEECLVFEDSVPGVESGRRAGMQAVWCPHPGLLQEYKGREREVLAGLTGEHVEDEGKLQHSEVYAVEGMRELGAPGELDDGWAKLLETLEAFPYQEFGI